MELHGNNLIGFQLSASGSRRLRGFNPRKDEAIGPEFHEATPVEVGRALELADSSIAALRALTPEAVVSFLLTIRDEILALGDQLVIQADEETALGLDRLRGERDRTTNQIKLFADIVAEGSWVDARIDTPLPERKPIPKPDLRRMLQPFGPVVVFGASNFPLAFSVAGGDTISALASRNPVVVKAHPAHPGTSELMGCAIQRAVQKQSLPEGTFSLLHGLGTESSIALVTHSKTKAVAFTGSQRAGRALFDAAARRPDPIPVFAEMGSTNPVFVLNDALARNSATIAEGLYRSVLLGVGQFCTCPGLVFAVEGPGFSAFIESLRASFASGTPGTMLNPAIARGYGENLKRAASLNGGHVHLSSQEANAQATEGRPALIPTNAATWLQQRELREEIFGPATMVVRCESIAEMLECAGCLEGNLTATIHGTPDELGTYPELVDVLSQRVGRLLFNGYPTGVEVGYAMQHGGPYPATTDPRFTSVGAAAILRFARPVCFQNFPENLLPPELQNSNPRGIWRMIDGKLTRDAL